VGAVSYDEGDTVEFNGVKWLIVKQQIIDFSGSDDYPIDTKITFWWEKA
jgi:hypothetical protein